MEFKTEVSTVECYKIRRTDGVGYWADINLDLSENGIRIQIASDFGSWQYYWGTPSEDKVKFLAGLDKYYMAGKFGCDKVEDLEKTVLFYKKQVIDFRREEILDAEKARAIWKDIQTLESEAPPLTMASFIYYNLNNLTSFFIDGLDVVTVIDPGFQRFYEIVWPVFIGQLKERQVQNI